MVSTPVIKRPCGGDVNVHCDCDHIVRSLTLPHIRHATLLHILLHLHTYVMLRCCTFSCTSTHRSCYASARSPAFPHIRHSTLLHVLLHFHTYVILRCCTFSCTSSIRHATLLHVFFAALPRIRHATLLHVLFYFHTYVMLRARTACHADGCKAWKGASKQQVPEKRLKWQNVAHNRGEFVKHLGRKPTKKTSSLAGTQTLDRQWGWLKSPIPRQLHTHKDCRQDIQKKWKYLYAAVWRKSVKGNVLNNLGQLCA